MNLCIIDAFVPLSLGIALLADMYDAYAIFFPASMTG
jgi:hypothetical protein